MNRRNGGLYSRRDRNNKLIYWAAFVGFLILVYSFIGGAIENDIGRVTVFESKRSKYYHGELSLIKIVLVTRK